MKDFRFRCIILIGLAINYSAISLAQETVTPIDPQTVLNEQVALSEQELNESSGLAFSHRDNRCIWSHNDSGDTARLFSFDSTTGQRTGGCELLELQAIDWEAMTSIPGDPSNGIPPRLIVADCGDNQCIRDSITLHQFDEPDPHGQTRLESREHQTLTLRLKRPSLFPSSKSYESVNCEAAWFDPIDQSIILLAKSVVPIAGVYRVPMSAWSKSTQTRERTRPTTGTVDAFRIASVPLPLVTGGDRDDKTGDIWLVNYWQALCFRRKDNQSLRVQLSQVPEAFPLPKWKQIEAVSVDHGSQVWITTEGTPTFLGRLKLQH